MNGVPATAFPAAVAAPSLLTAGVAPVTQFAGIGRAIAFPDLLHALLTMEAPPSDTANAAGADEEKPASRPRGDGQQRKESRPERPHAGGDTVPAALAAPAPATDPRLQALFRALPFASGAIAERVATPEGAMPAVRSEAERELDGSPAEGRLSLAASAVPTPLPVASATAAVPAPMPFEVASDEGAPVIAAAPVQKAFDRPVPFPVSLAPDPVGDGSVPVPSALPREPGGEFVSASIPLKAPGGDPAPASAPMPIEAVHDLSVPFPTPFRREEESARGLAPLEALSAESAKRQRAGDAGPRSPDAPESPTVTAQPVPTPGVHAIRVEHGPASTAEGFHRHEGSARKETTDPTRENTVKPEIRPAAAATLATPAETMRDPLPRGEEGGPVVNAPDKPQSQTEANHGSVPLAFAARLAPLPPAEVTQSAHADVSQAATAEDPESPAAAGKAVPERPIPRVRKPEGSADAGDDPARKFAEEPQAAPVRDTRTAMEAGLREQNPPARTSQPADAAPGAPQRLQREPVRPEIAGPVARDIRLELPVADRRVEVRLAERGGEVQVSVRTADAPLAQALRDHLPALSTRLEESGFHADQWRAGEGLNGIRPLEVERAASDGVRDGRQQPGGNGGRHEQQHDPGGQENQRRGGNRNQKGNGFAWLMSSIG